MTLHQGVDAHALQPGHGLPLEAITTIRTRHVCQLKAQRLLTLEEHQLLARYVQDAVTWTEMLMVKTWLAQ